MKGLDQAYAYILECYWNFVTSFAFDAPTVSNSLPVDVCSFPSLGSFRKRLLQSTSTIAPHTQCCSVVLTIGSRNFLFDCMLLVVRPQSLLICVD